MILVTGSLAFDVIFDFPGKFGDHILPEKTHILNVSFLVNEMRKGFGGTAGNIAYSLSLLGIRSAVMGVVGADFESYKEFLEKNEVDTSLIKTVNKFYTSQAVGITDSKDNQIWGFYTGADMLSENLSVLDLSFKVNFGIVAPHNPKAMLKYCTEYKKLKVPYLFDPGMQLRYFSGEDLSLAFASAKIIIGNDYEMRVMEKKTGLTDIHSLAKKGKIIITTLGEKGSVLSAGNEHIEIGVAKVKNASDPAGAGDAFRSGFMAGYLRKFPLKTSMQMGAVASAYTVERYGTTTHSYTADEFARRYFENFGEKLVL